MDRFISWIIDHLQIVVVIAFIVLPLLFNRKKKADTRTTPRKPMFSDPSPSHGGSKEDGSLESKVRRFFDELVDEDKPDSKPVAQTGGSPTMMSGTNDPIPSRLEPLGAPALEPKPLVFDIPEEGGTLISLPSSESEPKGTPDPYMDLFGDSIQADADTLPHAQPILIQADRDDSANQGLSDQEISEAHFEVIGEEESAMKRLNLENLVKGSREELQRAFVLKEILDRPMALRDAPFDLH